MPRSEGRIKNRIWSDRDWIALPIDCQWLYWVFISQPQFNHAGLVPIPRRMWTNLAADDDTGDRIQAALKLLIDRRYVAIDDDTDELLVRTYIRNDVQDGPPGTFRSAMAHAIACRSAKLRAVLYGELLRLDVALIENKGHHNGERPIEAYRRALTALGPQPGPGDPPSSEYGPDMGRAWHAGTMPHGLGDGEGEGEGVTAPVEHNSSLGAARAHAHTPARTPAPARDPAAPPGQDPPRGRNGLQVVMDSGATDLPERARSDLDEAAPAVRQARSATFQAMGLFDAEAARWPIAPLGRERGRWVHATAALIADGIPPAAIVTGMRACSAKGCGPRSLPSFVFGEANKHGPESRADRNTKAIMSRMSSANGPTLAELEAAEIADRAAIASHRAAAIEEGG